VESFAAPGELSSPYTGAPLRRLTQYGDEPPGLGTAVLGESNEESSATADPELKRLVARAGHVELLDGRSRWRCSVFGPARHSLNTLRIERKRGGVLVHRTDVTEAGVDAGVEPLPWP
jgi:hypothetical protein